mgnify:CR=1 FL=1
MKQRKLTRQYDKPLLAVLAGALSGIAKALVTFIGKKLGLATIDIVQIGAAIITKHQIFGLGQYIIGWIVHILISGFIGVGFYYSLILFGRDYLIPKAIGAGLFFWLVNSIIALYLGLPLFHYRNLTMHLILFVSGIIYGVTLGWLLGKYVFKEKRFS